MLLAPDLHLLHHFNINNPEAVNFTYFYFTNLAACTSGSASVLSVGEQAELTSPGYPYDVPEHMSCRWLLEAPEGQVTQLLIYSM